MGLTKVTQNVLDKHGRKNIIVNGNFDIWQRGLSQTADLYGSDDRWQNRNAVSTKIHTQETFALGQTDVPNNPKYYSRTVVTSIPGTLSYSSKLQRIEGVGTASGGAVTISFWAKADVAKDMAIEMKQGFGSGGSPSASINAVVSETITLSTTWQKFVINGNLPSMTGKTLGTSGDALSLIFWFEAGSNYDDRTNTLGNQSGTFDIAQIQLEKGSVATKFEHRPIGEELSLCQRYYQEFTNLIISGYGGTAGAMTVSV